ncbi:MAG TPA: sensor histidine kinase [Phototrophicaceae bacterium]|nr:sensor histidine kinase [Phototrophicaceae bacterium]
MQVEQALRALAQLRSAAPPTTSARLGEVITLLQELNEENVALTQELAATPPSSADLIPHSLELMRTSMELVRGQSEALRAGKLGRVTTEQADCLKLVYEYASSAMGLLETLDDITLLRSGSLSLNSQVMSGLDLLAAAWQKHFEAAEAREHHLNIHADDPLPSVIGDHDLILSVVSDLLDNAIRYTPFSGTIRITAETLGTHVLFSIADNGIGLSAQDMEQIGQPFWRALYQPLVRQHPGAGLHLYRARQILELHESELLFSGEPGMGSTFSFTLGVG